MGPEESLFSTSSTSLNSLERWGDFEDLLGEKDWVKHFFDDMNPSRRAIGHTGEMSEHAVARMELLVREWLIVVG